MSSNDSRVLLLGREISACRVCAEKLTHRPRPVVQFGASARIVIIGQAPGARVHASGIPWDDASGERLRTWTGISGAAFYDPSKIALVPMGFCYPGKGESGDLPPRPECASLWHARVFDLLPRNRLTLLVGSYAQARYLSGGPKRSMTENVHDQPGWEAGLLALPHPSWRSAIWMARNPWFVAEVLPGIQQAVGQWLSVGSGQGSRPRQVPRTGAPKGSLGAAIRRGGQA